MRLWKVCFLIPTKNEEASVHDVVRSLRGALDSTRFAPSAVIVVDDSVDATRRLAKAAGAEVIVGGGRGLGSAMYEGLKTAANLPCDFIVTVDGDGQADVAEVGRFLQPLLDDEADLVVASRFLEKGSIKYHYRFINNLGTHVLAGMLRRLTGLPLTDSHGGIRAMRREVAQELEMLGSHTYVQETIIDAVEKGFRVKEVASVWKPRPHGSSRVVSSIPRYVFYTLPILILRSGQHVRLLYSSGLVMIFFALAYFFVILAEARFDVKSLGDRVPAFVWITLTISIGFQCFFFGFMLQLIKELKYRLDRVGRSAPSASAAEYHAPVVEMK